MRETRQGDKETRDTRQEALHNLVSPNLVSHIPRYNITAVAPLIWATIWGSFSST